jgi:ppGpp synthetase/RelA/SpoT-type nucleotidyltranferase
LGRHIDREIVMASLDFAAEKEAFKEYYAANSGVFHDASDSLRTLLSLLLTDNDAFSTPQVLARVKERDECIAKFARKYQTKCEETSTPYEIKDYITDVVGIRVICLYETDIPLVRTIFTENFAILEESDKTQAVESQEGVFGYKGLHLDLKLLANRRDLPEYLRFSDLQFEVQLRTIVQDAWSVLDHKIKYKKKIPHELKRRINRLAALFELADQEFLNIRDETRELEFKAKAEPIPASEALPPPAAAPPVDAFSFLGVAQRHFPTYPFQGHKIDGFVAELLDIAPSLTVAELEVAITDAHNTIEEYKNYQHERYFNRLNPYTTIRHALYLSDRERYAPLLFDLQRRNFDAWLTGRNSGG